MGPQGSGKSVQGRMLAEKYHLCYISSGDLAREIASLNSEIGRKFKSSLDKGEMVDDKVLANFLRTKISSKICQNGYILDGYPRRFSQIEAYEPDVDKVVFIKINDQTAINRLVRRGRLDDTPKLIRKRLKLYHERTQPMIDYYKEQGKLIEVDGSQEINKVTQVIESYLGVI